MFITQALSSALCGCSLVEHQFSCFRRASAFAGQMFYGWALLLVNSQQIPGGKTESAVGTEGKQRWIWSLHRSLESRTWLQIEQTALLLFQDGTASVFS